jgi:hypothetical protein
MDSSNKLIPITFCPAPWLHTFISPQSERRMCCASREQATFQKQYIDADKESIGQEYNPSTLEAHWNSPHMMSVRKRMLAGETLDECAVCNDNLLNLHTYRQYFTGTLFPDRYDEIVANTSSEGSTTLKPVSFDYRISNLCNFKCRMCGEQLSSSWEAEKRKNGTLNLNAEIWMRDENKPKIQDFQKTVVEKELWDAAKAGQLEEIYWVGGEPLMYQIHWDIMQYLVDNDMAKNVIVRYNTNLSRTTYQKKDLYSLLPHFKKVNLCCSIDATGEIGEYIRTGLVWDSWLDNFKRSLFLNEMFGDHGTVIDLTITLPGLFDLKNLMKLSVDLNVKSYIKICFDFEKTAILSPMCLPREVLNPILDDLIQFAQSLNSPLMDLYIQTFEDMKTRPNFQDKYPDWSQGLSQGKQRYISLEQLRNAPEDMTLEKILASNEAAATWWKNI